MCQILVSDIIDDLCRMLQDHDFKDGFVQASFSDEPVDVAYNRVKKLFKNDKVVYGVLMRAIGKYIYTLLKNNDLETTRDVLSLITKELNVDDVFDLMAAVINSYLSRTGNKEFIVYINGFKLSVKLVEDVDSWVIYGIYNNVVFVDDMKNHNPKEGLIFIGYFSNPIEAIETFISIDADAYFAQNKDEKIRDYNVVLNFGQLMQFDIIYKN